MTLLFLFYECTRVVALWILSIVMKLRVLLCCAAGRAWVFTRATSTVTNVWRYEDLSENRQPPKNTRFDK